jgi:hypothetical protein
MAERGLQVTRGDHQGVAILHVAGFHLQAVGRGRPVFSLLRRRSVRNARERSKSPAEVLVAERTQDAIAEQVRGRLSFPHHVIPASLDEHRGHPGPDLPLETGLVFPEDSRVHRAEELREEEGKVIAPGRALPQAVPERGQDEASGNHLVLILGLASHGQHGVQLPRVVRSRFQKQRQGGVPAGGPLFVPNGVLSHPESQGGSVNARHTDVPAASKPGCGPPPLKYSGKGASL